MILKGDCIEVIFKMSIQVIHLLCYLSDRVYFTERGKSDEFETSNK